MIPEDEARASQDRAERKLVTTLFADLSVETTCGRERDELLHHRQGRRKATDGVVLELGAPELETEDPQG
jgi:hypothetical protein